MRCSSLCVAIAIGAVGEAMATERKAGVSICGCGFLGVYAMGAMKCILKCAPRYAERIESIYGSSSGSWIAVWVACGLDLDFLYKWVEQQIVEARQYKMGLLNPTFGMYRRMEKLLNEHLPRKAHHISRGRLKVSMTVLPQWENRVVSSFNTRKELINASGHSLSSLWKRGWNPD